ncbi:MAG: ribose 5-phosphate isomerase B [Clostridia bacterium]|nr:ribose 5-phosphate isomerase B [Clostridia bacterium]
MIFLGSDHRGFELKEKIKEYFDREKIEYFDCGTSSREIAHYPIIAKEVCLRMDKKKDRAILICGSGVGMSMAANKFKGIRAGTCFNELAAKDGKEHSDLNVLVLPGEFVTVEKAIGIIKVWRESEFLNGRYLDRLQMIEDIENENMK